MDPFAVKRTETYTTVALACIARSTDSTWHSGYFPPHIIWFSSLRAQLLMIPQRVGSNDQRPQRGLGPPQADQAAGLGSAFGEPWRAVRGGHSHPALTRDGKIELLTVSQGTWTGSPRVFHNDLLGLKSEWMSEVGFEKQYFQGRGDEKWHVQCFFLEVFIIGTWASWRISFSLMTYMVFRKPSFKKVRSMKTKDRAVVFQMFVTKANFSVFDSLMYFSEKRAQTIKEK